MDAFAECEEQKERVKACYADWFQRLWGGSFDKASCDQQTQDFRQCVEAVMQRKRREESKRENEWMDRSKEKSDEAIRQARDRVQRARDAAYEQKEEVKGGVKDKASDVSSKVQETAGHWKDKIKGLAGKAEEKADPRGNRRYD